jgi:hypothetical protein
MYLEVVTAQWTNNIKGRMIIGQLVIFAEKVHTSKWNFESKNKCASAWSLIFWIPSGRVGRADPSCKMTAYPTISCLS